MRRALLMLIVTIFATTTSWADRSRMVSLEGQVQPASPSIYMQSSHELQDAKGKLIAHLSGHEHNVDLSKVEDEWVKVWGEWKPTVEAGGQIFEVHSMALLSHAP